MRPQNLGDSLVMRNASKEDIPALLEHFKAVHGEGIIDQLRAMLEHYPRFTWEDSFIIENSNSGDVVSCVILLENVWVLDGIQVTSVEMEAVGTLNSYRNRGHIRLLNEKFEERATEHHPIILAVAGIPFFYRNLGYEYAASLGGGYTVTPGLIPKLPAGEDEPVTMRPVTSENFEEFLRYRDAHLPKRTWIRKIRPEDASYLMYELSSPMQEAFFFYLVKEKRKTIGAFFLARWENRLDIVELYLDSHQYVDAVLRFALARAHEWNDIPVKVSPPNQKQIREYVSARTQVRNIARYAWCIKIPSVIHFIETISPLFSDRLRDTEFQHFSGELKATTYKEGFSLVFEKGAFIGVSEKEEKDSREYNLRIPNDALTRLLMGYETLDEIMAHEPDVECAATMKPLVRVLFPKLEAVVDPYY
ncbi:MAG: GNAT family N-acetyltransferase [Candidatus Odinarchaeota archaeon]